MKLASSDNLFSGLPIRDLLYKIQFDTRDTEVQIAQSTIYGLTTATLNARRNSHLTHATEIDHQIRFPLKDRVDRGLKKLALACVESLKSKQILHIEIDFLATTDYLTQTVLNYMIDLGLVLHIKSTSESVDSDQNNLLTDIEKNILSQINIQNFNCDLFLDYARERIYCGDYQSSYAILSQIPDELRTDSCHYLLGLACNFFGRTYESEVHFIRFLQSEKLISKIKATYVLSMLYLRLHPKEKQCLATAETYLQLGHQLIEAHPELEDYYFHSVFNRNGYALCLFRRGQIVEALEMLDAGIEKLQNSGDGAKSLHQSVLIYNAVQCLKALGRFDECEKRCQSLLAVDPLFPEYWLELSIVFLEQEKFFEALKALQQAEKLDAMIPEIYALKGYLFMSQNEFNLAVDNYTLALNLTAKNSPNFTQYQSDRDYCVEQLNHVTLEVQ